MATLRIKIVSFAAPCVAEQLRTWTSIVEQIGRLEAIVRAKILCQLQSTPSYITNNFVSYDRRMRGIQSTMLMTPNSLEGPNQNPVNVYHFLRPFQTTCQQATTHLQTLATWHAGCSFWTRESIQAPKSLGFRIQHMHPIRALKDFPHRLLHTRIRNLPALVIH